MAALVTVKKNLKYLFQQYKSATGRNWSQPDLVPRSAASGLISGRRLPLPPPESQKPVSMPLPATPLPLSQKTVSLSTRNRKLPQVPKNVNGNAVGAGLTNPGVPPPKASSWASRVRNSKSFNLPFSSFSGVAQAAQRSNGVQRTGRGAKLPVIPGTVHGSAMMRTRPDRLTGAQSRSLDYTTRQNCTLETVVEAGRGVRKLPAQPAAQPATANAAGRTRFFRQNGVAGTAAPKLNGTHGKYIDEYDGIEVQPQWT